MVDAMEVEHTVVADFDGRANGCGSGQHEQPFAGAGEEKAIGGVPDRLRRPAEGGGAAGPRKEAV